MTSTGITRHCVTQDAAAPATKSAAPVRAASGSQAGASQPRQRAFVTSSVVRYRPRIGSVPTTTVL